MSTLQKQFSGYRLLGEMYQTIINCFQKCGFGQESVNSITNDNEIDEEFESLLTQLREDDEITVEDFVTFDDNLATSTVFFEILNDER